MTAQSSTNLRADSYFISHSSGLIEFQPFDKHLLIHSDISIPIKYEDSTPFSIRQSPANSGSWNQPLALTDANYLYGKTGTWTGISLVEADFNGDNKTDLLARTSLTNAKAFIIYGSSGARPERVDYLSGTEISSNTTIKDFDGDGKDEIAISSNGQIHTVYDVTGSSGNLVLTKNTAIEYRQFNLGDYIGYLPKEHSQSLVSRNKLQSRVDNGSGSLTLTLPIDLPNSDVETPKLGLGYFGGEFNSLGYGWSLIGKSSIEECLAKGKSSELNKLVTFCKDGRELVNVKSNEYKYKDASAGEISTFKLIKNNIPPHYFEEIFIEDLGDGRRIVYGESSLEGGLGNKYNIKSVTHKSGSITKYIYDDHGVLNKILYGNMSVVFEYSDKAINNEYSFYLYDDEFPEFFTEKKSILTKITIKDQRSDLSHYYLGYNTKGGIRLNNVQKCIVEDESEKCAENYNFISNDTIEIDESNYEYEFSREQFKFASFYSIEESWRKSSVVAPKVVFSELEDDIYNIKKIDLENGSIISNSTSSNFFGVSTGNDDFKPLSPVYYTSNSNPLFFVPFAGSYGSGSSTVSGVTVEGSLVVTGPTGSSTSNVNYRTSSNGSYSAVPELELRAVNMNGQFQYGMYSPHIGDASLVGRKYGYLSSGIIPIDINSDGISEIINANIYADGNVLSNLKLEVLIVSSKHPITSASGATSRVSIAVPGKLTKNQPYDFKVSPIVDFDGDLNPELIIRANGNYYRAEILRESFEIELRKVAFDNVAHKSLFDLDPLYLDMNGDGVTDIARVDSTGLKAFISNPALDTNLGGSDIGKIYHAEELVQNDIENLLYVDNGVSISNALTYDFNSDGKDDILVLKSGTSLAQVYLSNGRSFDLDGELSKQINIRASIISEVKISDYDRDGHAEIIEWVEGSQGLGKIRVIDVKNTLGQVTSVDYAGNIILDAHYEDVVPLSSGANIILPPLSRQAGYEQKIKELTLNKGAYGWRKEVLGYSNLAGDGLNKSLSFLNVSKSTVKAPISDSFPLANTYQDVGTESYKFKIKKRDIYLEKVDILFRPISGEIDASIKAFTEYYFYKEKELSGLLGKSKYFINYEFEKRIFSSTPGSPFYLKTLNLKQYTLLDDIGRIDYRINIMDGIKSSINYSYDPDLVNFVSKSEERKALIPDINKSDSSLVDECKAEDTENICSNKVVLFAPYLLSNGDKTGLLSKTTQFHGDSLLESTLEFGYADIESDPYYNKGKYANTHKVTEASTNSERLVTFGQPQSGQPSTIKQGSLAKTTYTYNPYGQVLTQVEPNGTSITNTYDGLGRQTSSISNIGANTTTSYNSCSTMSCPAGGYMYTETLAESGEKTRTYYDLNGAEVGSGRTNSDGVWLYSFNKYDIKGRVVKAITNAQSFSSTVGKEFKYRTDNLIAEMKEPKGTVDNGVSEKITTFAYDFKNKSSLSDQTLATELDIGNSLVKQTTIKEKHIALTVDGLTVPAKENTKIVWSSAATDRLLGHDLDLASHTGTLYYYDVWGKNSKTKVIGKHGGVSGVLATGVTTQTYVSQYDKAGNLVFSDRPGRDPITHTYNAFGELTKTIAADESFISMTYDDLGRIKTKSYSGITSANIDAKTYTWNYDVTKGLLSTIQDTTTESSPVDVESFTYKAKSPLVDKHSKTINGNLYSKTYTYDTYGRIEDEIFNGGYGFKHGYNNGQLSSIKDLAGSSIWSLDTIDRQGRPTLKTYFNDLKYHQAFETYSNQLTSRYLKKGTDVLDGEELFFDPLDNLVFKAASVGAVNADNLRMSYDDKNRISSVTDNNIFKTQQRNFGFDDFGNFLHKDSTDGKYSYSTYNGGYNSWISGYKLSGSAANESISYSASTTTDEGAGHITELAGFTLGYNEMGQPTSISNNSGYNTRFKYGPNDELVSVSYSDGRTIALWGDMQHVTVNAGSPTEESYYRYRKNAAIILKGAVGSQYNGSYVVHVDHLGSVRSIWDSAGTDLDTSWVGNQTFDAYGQPVTVMESVSGLSISDITDAGYTGQMMIKGTSFIHMNARLYDYGSGVFTSTDPLFADMQRAGGLNAYGYVYGNPFGFVDPSGMGGENSALSYAISDERNTKPLEALTKEISNASLYNNAAVVSVGVLAEKSINLKSSGQYSLNNKTYKNGFYGNQVVSSSSVRSAKAVRDTIALAGNSAGRVTGALGPAFTAASYRSDFVEWQGGMISTDRYWYRYMSNTVSFASGMAFTPATGAGVGLLFYAGERSYDGINSGLNKAANSMLRFSDIIEASYENDGPQYEWW